MRVTVLAIALGLWALGAPSQAQEGEETFGCEANPTGNPIGGGEGYQPIFTAGDFTVTTKEELLEALSQAQPGQVIFLPEGVEIDLTGHWGVVIPAGVTLAGTRGLHGSRGARIFTTLREGHTLMASGGDEIRLTGLRFEGAFGGTELVADHSSFLSIGHYGAEVDNCEISAFNVSGIGVAGSALGVRIHHNYLHHIQRSGYGYPVSTNASDLRVIANRFDYCRHAIASSGTPGAGYEAAWNLVGPHETGHSFDMHGGRDRGDNTDIAGDWMHVHHNTFLGEARAVVIRGVPSQHALIHNNWFVRGSPTESVVSGGNTRVFRNAYGEDRTVQEEEIALP
ncbi:MAG: hypothetical protein AB7Y46_05570 [Armatimonadota bacterium]